MANYITTDTDLTSVANAIRTKGGTSEQLTYPSGFVTAIENIPTGGGGGGDEKTVCYYDYDGTLVASYTPAEYAELSQHPANPTHTGLTAQGWNWTLADAKEYVAEAGFLDIGQNYVTTSGNTEIDITLDDPNYLHPYIILSPSYTGDEITIYWGDGSSDNEVKPAGYDIIADHVYAQTGDYTISLAFTGHQSSSDYRFFAPGGNDRPSILVAGPTTDYDRADRTYSSSIKAIRLGNDIKVNNSSRMSNLNNCEYITIPINVGNFQVYCFYGDSLIKQLTIPSGSNIASYICSDCYSMVSISLPKNCLVTQNCFANCINIKSVYYCGSSTTNDTSSFSGCRSLIYVKIPSADMITGKKILGSLFSSCIGIKSITIPDGITNINSSAFANCYSLSSVTIPNSVKVIESSAFYNCYNIKSITLPSDITSIGSNSFGQTSISQIVIPSKVETIGESAFTGCYALKSIEILSTVLTTINNYAFSNTSLKEFVAPSSLTSLGPYAFQSNKRLKNVVLSLRLKELNTTCFQYCRSLKDIKNIEGVNSVGTYAFQYCDSLLDDFANKLLRNVSSISNYVFSNCINLKNVIIPSTVTSIGSSSFANCYNIKEYHFRRTTPPSLSSSTSIATPTGTKIYVPAGCLTAYQTATNWSSKASYMVEEATVSCTGITLDKATETLAYTGDAKKITETITPSNCNQDIFYTTSDPTCVAVNNSGVIDAVDTGTCTITATCGTQTATCSVTVARRDTIFSHGSLYYWDVEDAGTSSARMKIVSTGESSNSKYRYLYRTISSSVAPTGCKLVGLNRYPFWFSYSTNSISIQCDSSIKATFYFLDVYTGATGYEDYAKYIGGDSGPDDPNVSKGDRTVSIPSGACGCVIQLYREDGEITSAMLNGIVISIA